MKAKPQRKAKNYKVSPANSTHCPEEKKPQTRPAILAGTSLGLFMVSCIAFLPMLGNGFIHTWDDGVYVVQNMLLRDLSFQGIVNIFKYGDDFQKIINNYHPATTLSLALNYRIGALSPTSYHVTNMLLHGCNAVLAFFFIYTLNRKRLWPALISGLLFAVHPMHVESVAWISERKDVLYVFFFLAGLIAYLRYLDQGNFWMLLVSLLLFILSCLSKAMAVPFPLVMLLIDYFRQRKLTRKMIFEKIPFFIVALVIGLMSVYLQSISAINEFETFTVYQRIMHASYGFITYLAKFFHPADLSAFYPYPAITTTGLLPLAFRTAPFLCLALAGFLGWVSTRKGEIPRVIVFGILFYFFTIALVLQFLSVGKAIMADRYTYLPFLGLSFVLGMITDHLIRLRSAWKFLGLTLAGLILILAAVFSYMTHERTKIWKDDITLWSDALEKYPDGRLNFIYEKRAEQYMNSERFEAALADYLVIVSHDPNNDNALECIGRIYGKHYNDIDRAVEYLEKAHAINPKNLFALKSLGVAMGLKGDFNRSLDYLLQAFAIDGKDTTLLRNISASYGYLGKQDKAKEFDQMALSLKSEQLAPGQN
jgi:hypothetical protein